MVKYMLNERLILGDACVAEGAAWLAAHDARFANALEITGTLPLRLREGGFHQLLSAIVSQQLSVSAAAAIWARVEKAGVITPEAVQNCSDEDMRALGLSRQKVGYVRALAHAGIDFEALPQKPLWNEKNQTTFGFGYRGHEYNTERYGGNKSLNSSFGYVQHYLKLKDLNIVAGGRYDNYSDFGSNFSPKVSATYNLGKFRLSSSVGYGFRVPDFRTLYINYGGFTSGYYVLGAYNIEEQINFYSDQNLIAFLSYGMDEITQLKSETSISYDFGISYKLDSKSKIGVNFFQTNTTDLIESVLAGMFVNQTLLFGYTNISEATFKGVELETLIQKDRFRFDGSYQYLETEANQADGTEFFLSERPTHLINLATTYTLKNGLSVTLNGVHKSEYFFRDVDRSGTQDPNEFVPSHTLLNTLVSSPEIKGMRLGVGVNNILDFTNVDYLKQQNGRTIFGKLTYKF